MSKVNNDEYYTGYLLYIKYFYTLVPKSVVYFILLDMEFPII